MEAITPQQAHSLLKEAHLAYLRKSSTMPDVELIGITKNKKRELSTTNGITSAICEYVKYVGGFANRINTVGRKIKTKADKEIYIPGTTKRGTPDIDVVFSGLAIKVEVKNRNTKDKVSDRQNEVRKQLEQAGAIYFVADSLEGFLNWFIPEIQNKFPLCRA